MLHCRCEIGVLDFFIVDSVSCNCTRINSALVRHVYSCRGPCPAPVMARTCGGAHLWGRAPVAARKSSSATCTKLRIHDYLFIICFLPYILKFNNSISFPKKYMNL